MKKLCSWCHREATCYLHSIDKHKMIVWTDYACQNCRETYLADSTDLVCEQMKPQPASNEDKVQSIDRRIAECKMWIHQRELEIEHYTRLIGENCTQVRQACYRMHQQLGRLRVLQEWREQLI